MMMQRRKIARAIPAAVLCLFWLRASGAVEIDKYCTDLQDLPNPDWSSLKRTLEVGTNSIGPAYGSTIRVNHEEIEKEGIYYAREMADQIALHAPTSSFIPPKAFEYVTRWYQEDGNTQIFRLFPGDDNVRNDRADAPRSEIFSTSSWQRGDGWHEWSGRYTFIKVRRGAVLQIKHNVTYWSLQLVLQERFDGTVDLSYVNLQNRPDTTILMEDVVGKGVDIKVLDDGDNHKVFVDQKLVVENSMTDRPQGDLSRARWGLYSPVGEMDREILILVTGAYVGPALEEDPSPATDTVEDLGEETEPKPSFWDKFYAFFDVEKLTGWLSPRRNSTGSPEPQLGDDYNTTTTATITATATNRNGRRMPIIIDDESTNHNFDEEPDPGFLATWYDDIENEGNGYM